MDLKLLRANTLFPGSLEFKADSQIPDGRFIVLVPNGDSPNTRSALLLFPRGTPADTVKTTLQIFGTSYTDYPTNYEAAEFTWETIGGTPIAFINVFKAGTGVQRDFAIFTGGIEGFRVKDNAGKPTPKLPTYTTATKPSAVTAGAGALIFVSDGAAGNKFQGSDGTSWLGLG